MAKLDFTIAHDIRIDGKVVKAGTKVSLDPEDPKDAQTLGTLRASGRLVGDVPEKVNFGAVSDPKPDPNEAPDKPAAE